MTAASELIVKRFGAGITPFTFTNVNIENYSTEPWLAEDQSTPSGSKVSISGTCMVSLEAWSSIRDALGLEASRLEYATMENGAANYLINMTSATSAIGGPYLKLTATQVIGGGVALIRFDLNDTTTICDLPVISHVWTQRMTVDAAGRLTRHINGTLRAARNATASDGLLPPRNSTAWSAAQPYADMFRRAILPNVPAAGWRRESQEFAYDSIGTGLLYQIIDKQYAYDLPNGVRVGDMEFTYERTVQDAGIGNCRVVVELEGDMSLMTLSNSQPSGNRRLVEAAVALSKARIDATYPFCIITRMAITERNILSGFSIRFELDSQVFPSNENGASVLAPIARMVGQRFSITRTNNTRTMDPYGAATPATLGTCGANPSVFSVYSMVPHYIGNVLSGMNCDGENVALPYASILTHEGTPDTGAITIAVCTTDDDGVDEMNAAFEDGLHFSEMEQPENAGGGVQIVSHSISTTNCRYDSGLVRMAPMYIAAAELVLQTQRPRVFVTERVEIARANTAPDKLMRPLPVDAMLVSDDWNVSFGKFDQQGTRMFVGVYERTFSMYDNGTTSGGYFTDATAYAGSVRGWSAPNSIIQPSISPVATGASQVLASSVFTANPTAANNYGVAAESFVT